MQRGHEVLVGQVYLGAGLLACQQLGHLHVAVGDSHVQRGLPVLVELRERRAGAKQRLDHELVALLRSDVHQAAP